MSELEPAGNIFSGILRGNKPSKQMTPEEKTKMNVDWYNKTEGELNVLDGYNCQRCKNKGFIATIDSDGYEVLKVCQCKRIRETLSRAKRSGLGDIITDFTFDKFIATEDWQKDIKALAKEFCGDNESKWFYIGGQIGCGKSHLCTAIAAYYIKAGFEVKYMLWAEESKRLKSVVNDISYSKEIEIYKNADVLYIDDFLKVRNGESPTTADMNLAFEIVNHRLLCKDKVTIISSEKKLDELMQYDEATMSRIYQKAGKYKISIEKDPKKNYRLK